MRLWHGTTSPIRPITSVFVKQSQLLWVFSPPKFNSLIFIFVTSLFDIGGYLSHVESLNPSQDTDFGWELDEEAHRLIQRTEPQGSLGRKRKHFGKHLLSKHHGHDHGEKADDDKEPPPWRWYGTDWKSLGFTANFIQLCGASIL